MIQNLHEIGSGLTAEVTITDTGFMEVEVEDGGYGDDWNRIWLDRDQLRELVKVVALYDPELVNQGLTEAANIALNDGRES